MPPFEEDEWAPYDTTKNFAEVHDLSEEHPDKLRELIELWWTEVEKYNVLPLEDRGGELFVLKRTRGCGTADPRPFQDEELAALRSDPGPRCRTDRAARNSARQTDLGTDSRRTWRVLNHRARPVGQLAAFDRSSSRRSGSVGVTSYPPGNGGRAGNPRPTRTVGSW